MFRTLEVLTLVLVAIGMGLSLAHALEFPGKKRLDRATYFAVQTIYYPGFTIGGAFGEFGAMLAMFVLLVFTPAGSFAFWLTLVAFAALLVAHGIYWAVTHKVNKVWLANQSLGAAGAAFFSTGGANTAADQEWTRLRDRWEYSHAARAVLAMLSLVVLAVALAL